MGSIGDANPSGWMNEEHFIKFAHHFVKFVKSSTDKPVLLLLDNHNSHLSIEALDFFKDNGVTVLSFPPHCSHKLQPLDRSVYGPFKKYYNNQCDAWITNHPGKTMTIYDIPGVVKLALPLACTPINIQAGFRTTGISPFNRNIFSSADFMPNYATDKLNPLAIKKSTPCAQAIVCEADLRDAGPSNSNELSISPIILSKNIVLPEEMKPLPKMQTKEETSKKGGKKRRSTAILTDTLVKLAIKEQKESKKMPESKEEGKNNKKKKRK